MQKMCLNCEYFEQPQDYIRDELTLGKCYHEEMIQHFNPEEFMPGTVLCCIHFKLKQNCADQPEPDVAIRNDSRTRGARSVLDALDAHKLRRKGKADGSQNQ